MQELPLHSITVLYLVEGWMACNAFGQLVLCPAGSCWGGLQLQRCCILSRSTQPMSAANNTYLPSDIESLCLYINHVCCCCEIFD